MSNWFDDVDYAALSNDAKKLYDCLKDTNHKIDLSLVREVIDKHNLKLQWEEVYPIINVLRKGDI